MVSVKSVKKMNNNIIIKSAVSNRIRIKSNIFASSKNLDIIQNSLENFVITCRINQKCKSIIITHTKNISTEELITKIYELFHQNNIPSTQNTNSVCGTNSSCNSCVTVKENTKTFKRKLVEFGILTGYSLYLFVSKSLLGITVASTPLSLVALVSLVSAIPLFQDSIEDIKQGKFSLQTFMSGTLLLAILFGEALAAFEIIYILRGGILLEEYVATRSKNEIKNLLELDIKKAYMLVDDIELEVDINEISAGDIIVSRSGEKIPVDGTIVKGEAQINEALINGRSESAYKKQSDEVYAGTMCEAGRIYIKATATKNDTYISRVINDVEKSLAIKSNSELEADKLASRLLKLGSLMTVGTLLLTGSFLNAFSVMIVMSCPCSTILAASTAISAGIANGAKQGILIKGGESLEKVGQSEVFCFDKTGTLTTGKPKVYEILVSSGVTTKELTKNASIAEYRNTHPIAVSIIEHAKSLNIKIKQEAKSEVIPGYGVKATLEKDTILVGNAKLFKKHNISIKEFEEEAHDLLEDGKTVVFIARNEKLLGLMAFEHEVRPGTQKMINDLRNKGVKHIALITGDEEKVANSFALNYHFDTVFANQSPYDKANAIEELKKTYKNVVMVGDGINDTLAMSKADVAISFAAGGSQAAIEVSNIAVTHSHPEDVVNLYDLSKKTLKVVNKNYWLGTSTNIVGAVFGALGMLSPAAASAIHIGHTTGIMANSSRLAIDNKS